MNFVLFLSLVLHILLAAHSDGRDDGDGLSQDARDLMDAYAKWHWETNDKPGEFSQLVVVTAFNGIGDMLRNTLRQWLWCGLLSVSNATDATLQHFKYRIQLTHAGVMPTNGSFAWEVGLSPRIPLVYSAEHALATNQSLIIADEEYMEEYGICSSGRKKWELRSPPPGLTSEAALSYLVLTPSEPVRRMMSEFWSPSLPPPQTEICGIHLRTYTTDNFKASGIGSIATLEARQFGPEAEELYRREILDEVVSCLQKLLDKGFKCHAVALASESPRLAIDIAKYLRHGKHKFTYVWGAAPGRNWSAVHSVRSVSPVADADDYVRTWAEWFMLNKAEAFVSPNGWTLHFMRSAMALRSSDGLVPSSAICTMSRCFNVAWDVLMHYSLHGESLAQARTDVLANPPKFAPWRRSNVQECVRLTLAEKGAPLEAAPESGTLSCAAEGCSKPLPVSSEQRCNSEASNQECMQRSRGPSDGLAILVNLRPTPLKRQGMDIRAFETLFNQLLACKWLAQKWLADDLQVLILFDMGEQFRSLVDELKRRWPRAQFVDIDELGYWAPPDKFVGMTTFKGGSKWFALGYRQMCEFWSAKAHSFAHARGIDYLMRMDRDSSLQCDESSPDLFKIMRSESYTYAYFQKLWDLPHVSLGFNTFVKNYIRDSNINLRGTIGERLFPLLPDFENASSIMYYTNFEISHVPYFLEPQVVNFTQAVVQHGGIYDYRWGDAIVRYAQVALFSLPDKVKCFSREELIYEHGCGKSGDSDTCCEPCYPTRTDEPFAEGRKSQLALLASTFHDCCERADC